jgi:phosphoribosylformylglycinamidine cyclo-ligase
MDDDAYDLAATGVGGVEADAVLGSDLVREGDVIVAMASSGLHSNGYSLVRHSLLGAARMRLDRYVDELETTLGECLLTPTRIYARQCLALVEEAEVHAFAHITGGGLASNIARVIPEGLDAELDRGSWPLPPLFRFISERGGVSLAEMERTFNNGVGMVAIVRPEDEDRAVAALRRHGVFAWTAGRVLAGTGTARLVGTHPA